MPFLIFYLLKVLSPSDSKESACNTADAGSMPGLGRSPGEGNGHPLQYSCLENPRGQRSLEGCSPWGHKESNMTEWLTYTHGLGLGIKWPSGQEQRCCWALRLSDPKEPELSKTLGCQWRQVPSLGRHGQPWSLMDLWKPWLEDYRLFVLLSIYWSHFSLLKMHFLRNLVILTTRNTNI